MTWEPVPCAWGSPRLTFELLFREAAFCCFFSFIWDELLMTVPFRIVVAKLGESHSRADRSG